MSMSNIMSAFNTGEPASLEQKEELEKVIMPVFRAGSMQEIISLSARDWEYLCVVTNKDSPTTFRQMHI